VRATWIALLLAAVGVLLTAYLLGSLPRWRVAIVVLLFLVPDALE
jgi:EamA domain-containing membrane protein RarD